jgi:sugar phosphate isomerase/epimerase
MIQYAFSTSAFRNYSLLEAFEKISAAGYHGVEIMCDRPHAYPPDLTRSSIRNIQSALARTHLSIATLNTAHLYAIGQAGHPSWIEREKEGREVRIHHTIDAIRLAEALGAKSISIPPGGPLNGKTIEEDLDLFIEGLERILPHAEEAGIKVLISTEPNYLISNSDQFLDWMGHMESPLLGLYCDIGHFFCVGEDPVKVLLKLSHYIGHIHFEDIAASRLHQHLIPGEGAIDFSQIWMALDEIHYDGFISMALSSYRSKPSEVAALALKRLKEITSNILPHPSAVSF